MYENMTKHTAQDWKTICTLLIAGCLAMSCFVLTAHAESVIPALPCEYYGNISINGTAAPEGTVITAFIHGEERGVMTSAVEGNYGSSAWFEKRLMVAGTADDDGLPITFKINGVPANESGTFRVGDSNRQDLNIVLRAFPRGDFNNNWYVDVGDVSMVAYMVINRAPARVPDADFNANGFVDIGDAGKIAWFKVGKINEL